ncbi:MAG TPA: hypothetical protein VE079_13450 [Ensifer sp.]|nr:hypothetical protein [Ensifer sp.]
MKGHVVHGRQDKKGPARNNGCENNEHQRYHQGSTQLLAPDPAFARHCHSELRLSWSFTPPSVQKWFKTVNDKTPVSFCNAVVLSLTGKKRLQVEIRHKIFLNQAFAI